MKKFLLILLALIIFPVVSVKSYLTVPNFRNITSSNVEERIEFLGTEQREYEGVNYTCWKYRVIDGNEDKYVSDYINQLKSRSKFLSNVNREKNWFFEYTGKQSENLPKIAGVFHIHVESSESYVSVNLVDGMYTE